MLHDPLVVQSFHLSLCCEVCGLIMDYIRDLDLGIVKAHPSLIQLQNSLVSEVAVMCDQELEEVYYFPLKVKVFLF